jgi:hypothetical protein
LGDVTGFLSDGQARRVRDRTRSLPPSSGAERIGSYFGMSTILVGAAAGDDVDVVAIVPHASGPYAPATDLELERAHEAFDANLQRAGVADWVRHVRPPSESAAALDEVRDAVDVLYTHRDHRHGCVRDDLRPWGSRVRAGRSLFAHHCYSSQYVILVVLRVLGLGRGFRYVGRERTLVAYVAQPLQGLQRLRNLVRALLPLGWFARNIAIKNGRRRITRRLAHREPEWPY